MKLIWTRIAYVNDINHFCIGNCLFKWSGIHMYNGVILKKKFPCYLVCFFLYVLTPFYTIKTTGMWRSEILINQNEDVNKIRQNKTQTCVLNSTQFDNSKKRVFFLLQAMKQQTTSSEVLCFYTRTLLKWLQRTWFSWSPWQHHIRRVRTNWCSPQPNTWFSLSTEINSCMSLSELLWLQSVLMLVQMILWI